MSQDYSLILRMTDFDTAIHADLAETDVTHIELSAYQPGQPHYEQLMSQLADAKRFPSPTDLTLNV
jgi:hypothetical protein